MEQLADAGETHPRPHALLAANNAKEQIATSPDLNTEVMNAVMDARTAHAAMSKQVLESEKLHAAMKRHHDGRGPVVGVASREDYGRWGQAV